MIDWLNKHRVIHTYSLLSNPLKTVSRNAVARYIVKLLQIRNRIQNFRSYYTPDYYINLTGTSMTHVPPFKDFVIIGCVVFP